MNFELLNSRLGKIPLEIRDSLAAIVWLQFRATQSQENITLIGDVLRLRGQTIKLDDKGVGAFRTKQEGDYGFLLSGNYRGKLRLSVDGEQIIRSEERR